MPNPKVSICIPAYNGAKFIERALLSSLNQDYKNIEVIVTDDQSADNTKDIVLSYAKKDSRVKYFENNERKNVIPNYLHAFSLASGDYIQPLGQDDWLSRNYIGECVKVFNEHPEAGAVFTVLLSVVSHDQNNTFVFTIKDIFKKEVFSTEEIADAIYKSNMGAMSFTAMRRKTDAALATREVQDILRHEKYGHLYRKGFSSDWVFALAALTNHRRVFFTDRAAYINLGHREAAGGTFGLDFKNKDGIYEHYNALLASLPGLYREKFPKQEAGLKIFLGVDLMTAVIFQWAKNKFLKIPVSSPHRLFVSAISLSRKEKAKIILGVIPALIKRMGNLFLRKLARTNNKIRYSPLYFLNKDGQFEI